ncbi:MAG TPA: hypothetical protein VEJ63_14550 [Planctomycetota bacterium]|nr:hypothetical protein [Planctomycetota bacterium]
MLRQWIFTRSQQPENAYGPFTLDLLKAEGLNGFELLDIDRAPIPELGVGDIVVLTRCFLRHAETDQIVRGVENGCSLVWIQPPCSQRGSFGRGELAQRLGWMPQFRVLRSGRVRPGADRPGAGLPLQTHVPVTVYSKTEGAVASKVIAEALHDDKNPSGSPAVIEGTLGKGRVALFFYDVPKAVAMIRFGNPELASHVTGGWTWAHPLDLFTEHYDRELRYHPQADYHTQLLAQVVSDLSPQPLARLWYYENPEQRTAACLSSDDDWSTREQFEDLSSTALKHGARITFYMMEDTKLSNAALRKYQQQGHSFGPHVNAFKKDAEHYYFNFPAELHRETEVFRKRYGSCSASLQAHCAPWLGYQAWVGELEKAGYRMTLAYFCNDCFNGYMVGSGRPMRMYTPERGRSQLWQQALTTWDDQSLIPRYKAEHDAMVAEFEQLLQASLTHHSAMGFLSHPVSFSTYSKRYMDAVMGKMAQAGVPMYSADDWCAFQDRRDAVRLEQSATDGNVRVKVSGLSGRQTLMLPLLPEGTTPKATVDGKVLPSTIDMRLGRRHVFIALEGNGAKHDQEIEITF